MNTEVAELSVTEHSLPILTDCHMRAQPTGLGEQLPMLGVARAQEACREEVGQGQDPDLLRSCVKELDSEGQGELPQGLKQGSEETRFLF